MGRGSRGHNEEFGDARAELGRKVITVGFPVGMDEKLFQISVIFGSGKEKLDMNISAETLERFSKCFRRGRRVRWKAEIMAKTKQEL
jgi:hypothetical protein